MKDDYLWDGTGEPDEEIQQLEALLGGLKHQPHTVKPVMPASLQLAPAPVKPRFWHRTELKIAVAASILLMLSGTLWFMWAGNSSKPISMAQTEQFKIPVPSNKNGSGDLATTTIKPAVPVVKDDAFEPKAQNNGIEISNNIKPRSKKIYPMIYKTKVQPDTTIAQEASTQLLSALQIASGKLRGAMVKAKLTENPEIYNFRQNKQGEDL